MAVYRATAQVIYGVEVFVEAETQAEAEAFACDMDRDDFEEYDDDWRWDKTEEISTDELKYYGNVSIHKANEEED